MRKAGANETQIKNFLGDIEDQTPVMLESNITAFKWFLDVQSALKPNGLDIIAVKADADMMQREFKVADYIKLKHIGLEAANALNESKKS